MVRTTLLILVAAITAPAAAQNTTTQCRWIGNVWSCDSQTRQNGTAPVDQGKLLEAGASIIKPIERPIPREPRAVSAPTPIPPPISIAQRYGMNAEQRAMIAGLLKNCPTDDRATMKLESLPENQRSLSAALCYAYDRGRTDGYVRAIDGN